MILELEEPFKSLWRRGYLRVSNENRRIVDLFNTNSDRTTISYARYLMCVKLGYVLSNEFEVDHINDDKTDDRIENLQVLTCEQNKIKQLYKYIEHEQITYGFCCAYCRVRFILTENELKCRLKQGRVYAFCSRSCSSSFVNLLARYL